LQIKDSAGTGNLTLAAPASVVSSRWGNNFTLVLKNDGTLLGWGHGSEQLGIGTFVGTTCGATDHLSLLPIRAAIGLDHIVAVESGPDGAIAVKDDGTVWVWGGNTNNALGVNTGGTLPVLTPMQVPGLP
jgi:alpha-tubulin suppressor-like RCC1 family protein